MAEHSLPVPNLVLRPNETYGGLVAQLQQCTSKILCLVGSPPLLQVYNHQNPAPYGLQYEHKRYFSEFHSEYYLRDNYDTLYTVFTEAAAEILQGKRQYQEAEEVKVLTIIRQNQKYTLERLDSELSMVEYRQ